jgi:DNA-binding response OmpR family regulator
MELWSVEPAAVLVVDDEPALTHATARVLGRAYAVVTASTVDEALEAIEARPELAAVVTDYELDGGRSGREVLDRARTVRPQAARIVVSGALDAELVVVLSATGLAHRCLAKPWQPAALLDVVRAAVAERGGGAARPILARSTPDAGELARPVVARVVRRHLRYAVACAVEVRRLPCRARCAARSLNASEGGMLLELATALAVGDRVELLVALPTGGALDATATVRHIGLAAWVDGSPAYRAGVEFGPLDAAQLGALAAALGFARGNGDGERW